jgi:hypothetical protein
LSQINFPLKNSLNPCKISTECSTSGNTFSSYYLMSFCICQVIEIFTDTMQTKRGPSSANEQAQSLTSVSITRESQNACMTRESFRKFITLLQNKHILGILFSLVATIYNICDTSCNIEITSAYRHVWPSTITTTNNLNLNFLNDILNILMKTCYRLDSFNSAWLRTIGDIYVGQIIYNDALKYYIQNIINETKYFFVSHHTQISRIFNEKLLKLMIKSCLNLNKYLHVAILCQYLPVIDYQLAFKCMQEKYSNDTLDGLYKHIWDVTLYEYLIYTNTQRNFTDKRDLAIKLCSHTNSNESNPKDVRQNTIDCKRTAFFTGLTKYYLT